MVVGAAITPAGPMVEIRDLDVRLDPAAIESLLGGGQVSVHLAGFDLAIPEALVNAVLAGLVADGRLEAAAATLGDGTATVAARANGRDIAVDLGTGGVRIALAPGAIRVHGGTMAGG